MTSNSHQTLERIARRVPVPEPAYDRLLRRRDRRTRNRRVSAATLAIAIALLSITGLIRAFRTPQRPAHQPVSKNIFSGLGGWIAYGNYGIWAMDPQQPRVDPAKLSTDPGEPIAWSGDGSKLLILRQSGQGSRVDESLHVLYPDGSETLLIDAGAGNVLTGGSFSPDGSKVVFAEINAGESASGIYVTDARGGTSRRLLAAGRRWNPTLGQWVVLSELSGATFSPDGSQIAYFDGWGDHDNTLRVMNADGSGTRVLLKDAGVMRGAVNSQPVWSPGGTRLAFSTGYSPDRIYVVGVDGSGLTRLIANAARPWWSPDGSRIAYDRFDGSGWSLAIADADGTHIQRFDFPSSGPWNPLPRTQPATQGASATAGATGAGTPTYAIALLTVVGCVAIWRHRKDKRWEQLAEEIE